MPPIIDDEKCTGCGRCVDACQSDVFFGSAQGEIPRVTYPEECWHCNACVRECPVEGAVGLRVPLPMMIVFKEGGGQQRA